MKNIKGNKKIIVTVCFVNETKKNTIKITLRFSMWCDLASITAQSARANQAHTSN